jgi:hypothetical protein
MDTATNQEMALNGAEFVHVGKLKIDSDYQRGLDPVRVTRMANAFDPDLFLPLLVSRRHGSYYVIDGQHRLRVAETLGFRHVPCLITRHTQAEEASLFNLAQTSRKSITPIERHRALFVAGNEEAKTINDIIARCGLTLTSADTHDRIECIKAVYRINRMGVAAKYDNLLETVLNVVVAAWPQDNIGRSARMVSGLGRFLVAYAGIISIDDLITRLRQVDARQLINRMKSSYVAGGNDAGRVGATEILAVYNKGRRAKLLDPTKIVESFELTRYAGLGSGKARKNRGLLPVSLAL